MRYASRLSIVLFACSAFGCVSNGPASPQFPVAKDSAQPGTSVKRMGQTVDLADGSLGVDKPLPEVPLADETLGTYVFKPDGKVKLVSVVPSIDTRVCEEQTHILSETASLDPKIVRITVSRDLPMAQKRFAQEANLTNVTYLSDYRAGAFGKASGLLMEESGLLARAVMVVDGDGKVRYLQVVPDITQLPDMDRAIAEANKIAR
jgi:thiol peroxidase